MTIWVRRIRDVGELDIQAQDGFAPDDPLGARPLSSASPPPEPRSSSGAEWLHEIKFDGYRLRVERSGDRVRLIAKGGYNWLDRYPWVVETALKVRQKQFVIDGEAVILGVDGRSDFDALHSGKHNDEVQL